VSDIQVTIPEHAEFEVPPVVPENDPESEPEFAGADIEPDAATDEPEEAPIVLSPSLPEASLPPQNRSAPSPPAPTPPAAHPKPRHENVPSQPKTAAKDAEAERVLALLNDTAPAKEAGQGGKTAKEKVFVQVAAYSRADRAAKQVEELKKQGFAAYAEKSGKVTRVRIGPMSRSEGERVVARLKAKGQNAVLSSR
jgi:DedD protein